MPDLCTLEEVKDALGITDTSQDAQLERLISAASIEILREMHRPDLTPDAEYTDRLCGDGSCEIFLKHWPINSISSVKFYGEAIDESDGETSGWFFDASVDAENRSRVYLVGMCFPPFCYPGCGHRHHLPNIVIEYNAGYGGYGADDVPADIVQAAIEQTAYKRSQGQVQAQDIGVGSVSIGDYTESSTASDSAKFLATGFPQSVKDVIERYRRVEL